MLLHFQQRVRVSASRRNHPHNEPLIEASMGDALQHAQLQPQRTSRLKKSCVRCWVATLIAGAVDPEHRRRRRLHHVLCLLGLGSRGRRRVWVASHNRHGREEPRFQTKIEGCVEATTREGQNRDRATLPPQFNGQPENPEVWRLLPSFLHRRECQIARNDQRVLRDPVADASLCLPRRILCCERVSDVSTGHEKTVLVCCQQLRQPLGRC